MGRQPVSLALGQHRVDGGWSQLQVTRTGLGAIGYFPGSGGILRTPESAGGHRGEPALPVFAAAAADGAGKPGIGPLRFAQPAANIRQTVVGYWRRRGTNLLPPGQVYARLLPGKGAERASAPPKTTCATRLLRNGQLVNPSRGQIQRHGQIRFGECCTARPAATKFRRPATKGTSASGLLSCKRESDAGKSPGTNGAQGQGDGFRM